MLNGRILLFLFIISLDQFTKYIADTYLVLHEPVVIIPEIFNFTLVYNRGAAFGMFSNFPDPWRQICLWGVSMIALVVVIRFMYKEAKDDLLSSYALSAVLAGALGNILDRYRMDYVVDFLDFYWKNYHWPAFNVADSAISLGVMLLILKSFVKKNV